MTGPLVTTPALVNLRAAAILREGGWCQGHLEYEGRHCAIGAIYAACDELATDQSEWDTLAFGAVAACEDQLPVRTLIPAWNDAPTRTADEVIAVLERAGGAV